MLEQINPAGVI